MRSAIAYEWVRIRTIGSTWWLTGITVTIGVLIALGISASAASFGAKPGSLGADQRLIGPVIVTAGAAAGAPCLTGFVLAMIGVFAWGHEYRHGMIRASLTTLSSRAAFWVAKFAVVAVWVAAVTFGVCLVSGVIGWLFLHQYSVPVFSGRTWGVLGREVGYVVVLTCLAMAITALTRSQAFSLVTVFLWPLVVESVITIALNYTPRLRTHGHLARFLPFRAGSRMLDVTQDPGGFFGIPLSAAGGFVIFGGVAAVLMAVSWSLLRARDA